MKYRDYEQQQGLCLPNYLEDMISEDSVSRVINSFVDSLSMDILEEPFKASKCDKGGNRPYHPKPMLKILLYAYTQGIFTSRKIEKQLKDSITFMWLSGYQIPGYVTINRYRSIYFVDILPKVLVQFVCYLAEKELIDLYQVHFIDGTKMRADGNKNKIVWKKNVDRFKKQVNDRVKKSLKEIEELDEEDMKRYGNPELPALEEDKEYNSEEIQEISEKLSESLEVDGRVSKTETGKTLRKISRQSSQDAEKMAKYEQQEKDLSGKNSMSKTDKDAPVMKSKQGQYVPAYNPQVATNNAFIVANVVSQNANDGSSLPLLFKRMQEYGIPLAREVVADSGYGYEMNYNFFEDNQITAFVKYPAYHAEISKQKKYAFHKSRFCYDSNRDIFICPMGYELSFEEEIQETMRSGYIVKKRKYRCYVCDTCPSKDKCTKSIKGRTIQRNEKLEKYQKQVKNLLKSDYGSELYKKRGYEVETVFGEMKRNLNFRRFHVRGLKKVSAEMDLLCLAFNLNKLSHILRAFLLILIRFLNKLLSKPKPQNDILAAVA